MSDVITKGYIFKEDLSIWDGADLTGIRKTSTGGIQTLSKFDWVGLDVYYNQGARTTTALQNAINTIGSTNKRALWLSPGSWKVTSNLTIPSNIALILPPGSTIEISAGITLTINGYFDAPINQIFESGTGTVVFGLTDRIYADWFGASRDKACLSNMLSMVGSTNQYEVFLSNDSTWDIDDDLSFSNYQNLQFTIPKGCIFNISAAKTLTWNSPEQFISHKKSQIFTGSGTVSFTYPGTVYCEMWGENTTPGTTDMTAEIQAALNSGAGHLKFFGDTYLVSSGGHLTYRSAEYYYCLLVPSNTQIDLQNETTLKLANAANSTIFMNSGIEGAGNTNIYINGGILDGNQANQTDPPTGDQSLILFHDVTYLKIERIKFTNVRMWAVLQTGITLGIYKNLYCTDSDGDAFYFGVHDPGTLVMTRCTFDKLIASNCSGEHGAASAAGHGFSLVGTKCFVNNVEQYNCKASMRISLNTASYNCIGQIISRDTGTGGYGVWLRGYTDGADFVEKINVGSIITSGSSYCGVQIEQCNNINIGRIISYGDCTAGGYPAIWIGEGSYINIDSINVQGAGQDGVTCRTDSNFVNIGNIIARNNGQVVNDANIKFQGDNVNVANIISIDDQTGVETVTYGVAIQATVANIILGNVNLQGDFTSDYIQSDAAGVMKFGNLIIESLPYIFYTAANETVKPYITAAFDTTANAIAATLGSGNYAGQHIHLTLIIDGGNNVTLTVTNHETSDPEVFTFADEKDTLVLEWNGTCWITIANSGVAT